MNKNITWCFCICILMQSCSDDFGSSPIEDIVISEQSPKEVFFTLSLTTPDGYFIVVNQIDSIELEIDGKLWGTFKSEEIDTASLDNKFLSGDFHVDANKVAYLAIDQYINQDTVEITTAGQVVEQLSKRILLNPGDHIGRIKQLQIQDENGGTVSVTSIDFLNFHVGKEDESVFIGEFEIETYL